MMRRILKVSLITWAVVLVTATAALAQNPHFIGSPRATDIGTQLRVSGSIAGLGNENIDVIVSATGTASVVCTNPGGNRAPGQDTSVTTTGSVSNLEPKNGRVNFTVTTAAPTVPNTPTCPNAQWTATVTNVAFTSYTITVIQPSGSGNVVLSQTFQL